MDKSYVSKNALHRIRKTEEKELKKKKIEFSDE